MLYLPCCHFRINNGLDLMIYTCVKKWSLIVALILSVVGCASTPPGDSQVKDPLQGFNRAMFSFNDGVDIYFLKPVAQGYRYITPDIVETGVSNFFSNLLEIRNLVNAGLQGKGKKTLTYTWRFLINSTVGVMGIFDVAGAMGLETSTGGEDFGQTLATWGVGSGPYVVLPLLGPSTLRDTFTLPADAYLDPIGYIDHVRTRNSTHAGKIINTRASLLETEKLITGDDKYIFVRDAYLQNRHYLIKDGKIVDSFGDDLEGEDF